MTDEQDREEVVRCDRCKKQALVEDCLTYDASADDEYYPDMRYICPGCQR